MTFELILIAAITAPAVIGSLVLALRDGYGRIPTRRV
jgi:hypothetical protein